nr:MAG TPA: hypothetical protein [Caudoviricetes sp.]
MHHPAISLTKRRRRLATDAPRQKNRFSSWISATFLLLRPEFFTLRLTTISCRKCIYVLGGRVAVIEHGVICTLYFVPLTELRPDHHIQFKCENQGEIICLSILR